MTTRIAPLACLCAVAFCFSFLPSGVKAQEAPSPESVIGFEPGSDSKLADWGMILKYFTALDEASDRVAVEKIGESEMGRDMILAVITSEENLSLRSEIQNTYARLADPRGLEEDGADRLIQGVPAAVLVGCAQHATEIASTQMSMEIAYRVAAEESDAMDQVRKNVVFLLIPSLNPDGHQLVCDWYREHLGTPYEGSRMPWVYHKYVGHDINRDWAMLTQAETRNVSRVLYERWFPQCVIDVHQMGNRGARMFIPPYYDPINPNIDPLIQHELALLGAQMQLDLHAAGQKGVITNAMFDEWLLGYLTSVPTRHNMVAQLIEMASVNIASPVFQRQRDLSARGGGEYARRANFPEPWEGGWWRLRDIVEYELTAVRSALGLAARQREVFLKDFYRLGLKQVDRGRTEPPFAFLVPPGQRDPATAWKMIEVLRRGGVEVHRAEEAFQADGVAYPEGTWVILMAQPYRAHAKDLLEQQVYPDLRLYPGGPPERPYDNTGWTLSLLMGAKTVQVVEPFEAELILLEKDASLPQGRIDGGAADTRYLLVDRAQNNAYILLNRIFAGGGKARTLVSALETGGKRFAPGTLLVSRDSGMPDVLENQVKELGLVAQAVPDLPAGVESVEVRPVRFGLYQPWTASMDEGWTRFVLEQFEFPYRSLHDAEVRAGGLIDRYDVILLPDLYSGSIVEGNSEGSVPKKYTGGIGEEGVFALRDFVREGGTLVAMDSSCDFLIEKLELPVTNIQRQERRSRYDSPEAPATSRPEEGERFFCPGSILRINVDNTHPLAYGMPAVASILYVNSPVFDKAGDGGEGGKDPEGSRKRPSDSGAGKGAEGVVVVGSYPKVNPLLSGWVDNDGVIHGKAALIQASFGEGTAVLIGFRPQFRAQPHGTFKVLFNAVLGAGSTWPVKNVKEEE